MILVTLTNSSAIKHQEVLLNVTLIRNHSEFEVVLYLNVNYSTKAPTN